MGTIARAFSRIAKMKRIAHGTSVDEGNLYLRYGLLTARRRLRKTKIIKLKSNPVSLGLDVYFAAGNACQP